MYLLFKDISEYQGSYDMDSNPDPAIMMKVSGGDAGLYYDKQAALNYVNATHSGKVPMMYHFYGGGDPIEEADFFIRACSPLASGDIMALDIEKASNGWDPQTDPDVVSKVASMAQRIHDRTGMWPWVYMNISTSNMYDWTPVFNNCAFWCAAPSYGFDDDLPVRYMVMAQQGPIVGGIDTDAFFGTLEQLKAYGYQAQAPQETPPSEPTPPSTPTPDPAPTPAPAPEPADPPAPEPTPDPTPTPPAPAPAPSPTPAPGPAPEQATLYGYLAKLWAALVAWLKGWKQS